MYKFNLFISNDFIDKGSKYNKELEEYIYPFEKVILYIRGSREKSSQTKSVESECQRALPIYSKCGREPLSLIPLNSTIYIYSKSIFKYSSSEYSFIWWRNVFWWWGRWLLKIFFVH